MRNLSVGVQSSFNRKRKKDCFTSSSISTQYNPHSSSSSSPFVSALLSPPLSAAMMRKNRKVRNSPKEELNWVVLGNYKEIPHFEQNWTLIVVELRRLNSIPDEWLMLFLQSINSKLLSKAFGNSIPIPLAYGVWLQLERRQQQRISRRSDEKVKKLTIDKDEDGRVPKGCAQLDRRQER